MSCKYNYYKQSEVYYPRLYCSITNNSCIYSKKCEKEEKYISLENQKECYLLMEEARNSIPNGSCFIETYRINKLGNVILYVNVKDKVVKVKTDLTGINQNYIYLKETIDGYQYSLTPFKKTRKSKLDE